MTNPAVAHLSAAPLAPPIITQVRDLLRERDVVLCDVWGVLHDGVDAYVSAGEALALFRAGGGTVILVSNAPNPQDRVAAMLDARHVRRDAWDGIVSSGDLVLRHVAEMGYERVHAIGPRARDLGLFSRLTAKLVPLADAEAVVCSGLADDVTETAETYRPVLTSARARGLPFVCANPDLVVDVGGRLYVCAGAVAALYQEMGGAVFWAGKPYAVAYDAALLMAERLRGSPVARARVLAIGDSLRTDIVGAANAGIDALFIASGIHREDVQSEGRISPAHLARMFRAPTPQPLAVMSVLA